MNITIPFSKDIPFKSKIAEICSISLEEDISINEKELLGDFIISGDYKNLDINVDTMPFNFVVPFSVELEKDIDLDTLKYEIYDFKYDIISEDVLNVSISFHVEADKVVSKHADLFEKPIEDDLVINEELISNNMVVEEENASREDVVNVIEPLINEENEDENIVERDASDANLITSHDLEEDYITYHIHLVKINETIESISSEYKIDKEELMELNDVTNVNVGDKLIIPINNETE